jgi:methylglyoxal/glyoxal reductase
VPASTSASSTSPSGRLSLSSRVRLANGVEMPVLGLGVFRTGSGAATEDAVGAALDAGYRHVDTARIYRNEREVGSAIRRWCERHGVERRDVFVTTKLWNDDHGFDRARAAFDASLAALGLDYVDLYLIHWPVPERRRESWRALETVVEEGRCRAIGVSNFTVAHLDELLQSARVVPAVNQVELHPFLQQEQLVRYCAKHRIVVEAYSPLTKGRRLADPRLVSIAREVGRSPAQVLIRWSLEKGFVVIPKSADRERIVANADVFDFELDDKATARLDRLEESLRTAWDPSGVA